MRDRRLIDRRQQLIAIRFPDRRRGFQRRRSSHPLRRAYNDSLWHLRHNTTAIALLASLLLALNVADLALTQRVLRAGAIEINPVMAHLFEIGHAATVKLAIGAAVVGTLWHLRRYRPVLGALVWLSVGMGMLVTYQALLFVAAT